MAIKFFYNGMKVEVSKELIKAHFSFNQYDGKTFVKVHACDYCHFPKEIREEFAVENNTDMMTDYFEDDRFTATAESKYWKDVLGACLAGEIRFLKKIQARHGDTARIEATIKTIETLIGEAK